MIDLTNYSKSEVKTYCDLLKLTCSINGTGYVKTQSIPVNSSLNENKNLELNLELLYPIGKEENKEDTEI